jgi:hypothetical protein
MSHNVVTVPVLKYPRGNHLIQNSLQHISNGRWSYRCTMHVGDAHEHGYRATQEDETSHSFDSVTTTVAHICVLTKKSDIQTNKKSHRITEENV